jgi:predicted dehydrogenase
VVDADDIDVVHICTPNHLHAPVAAQMVATGKHVICDSRSRRTWRTRGGWRI